MELSPEEGAAATVLRVAGTGCFRLVSGLADRDGERGRTFRRGTQQLAQVTPNPGPRTVSW